MEVAPYSRPKPTPPGGGEAKRRAAVVEARQRRGAHRATVPPSCCTEGRRGSSGRSRGSVSLPAPIGPGGAQALVRICPQRSDLDLWGASERSQRRCSPPRYRMGCVFVPHQSPNPPQCRRRALWIRNAVLLARAGTDPHLRGMELEHVESLVAVHSEEPEVSQIFVHRARSRGHWTTFTRTSFIVPYSSASLPQHLNNAQQPRVEIIHFTSRAEPDMDYLFAGKVR